MILADVLPGGPAEKAGLEPGDIVLTLDGKPMENGRQFRINVYTRGVGEQVGLEVRRGERTLNVRVPVVERANDTGELEALIGSQQAIRPLGIVALDSNPSVAVIAAARPSSEGRGCRARDARYAVLAAGAAAGRAT